MKKLLYLSLFAFLINGCAKKIDDPMWIKIDNWQLNENPFGSNQGEMSENLTDVWVNMDGELLGVFSLPIKIPVIANEGDHEFILVPGIKEKGISATKSRYTLMENYSATFTLKKGDTLEISPETQYYEDLTFWVEDFENINNLKIEETSISAPLETEDDPNIVKYGNYCAHIQLTDTDSIFYAYTTEPIYLPLDGSVAYLEVDFMGTHDLSARFINSTDGSIKDDALATMSGKGLNQWTKIYFNLNELMSYYNDADFYGIAFRAIKESTGLEDIYIDNVKIIY